MKKLFTIDCKDYDEKDEKICRPSVRGIILSDKNHVAMVYSQKYHYYKFPGGGIEGNESHLETLTREIKEETGLTLIPSSVKEFGEVLRIQKGSIPNSIFVQQNFYYTCQVEDKIENQNLDNYEKEADFILQFVSFDDAIKINSSSTNDNPIQKQMIVRDTKILNLLKSSSLSSS